jgi:hypothetical protein
MSTVLIRITLGAPLVAIALTAFAIALLVEWIADLTRACPNPEKHS